MISIHTRQLCPYAELLIMIKPQAMSTPVGAGIGTWKSYYSSGKKNRFILGDLSKNIYGTNYHVREPETRAMSLTMPDFQECFTKWTTERVFLKVSVTFLNCHEFYKLSALSHTSFA